MMTPLNISSADASSGLLAALAATGAFVTHYEMALYVDGTPEQISAALVVATGFDLAAGVFADKVAQYETAVQAHLDTAAQALGYDSILSACSYAGYTNPFQAEGQSFCAWRGAVWDHCYTQLAAVQAGQRTEPTVAVLIAELPVRT